MFKQAGIISSFLHQHLKPGSVLEWKGAAGDFVPDEATAPVLLMAGGIGEHTHVCANVAHMW